MAILLLGMTACPICGKPIQEDEDATLFSHFVMNEADPLFRFSDSACHTACLHAHALGEALVATYQSYRRRTGPGQRHCAVCGEEILEPDDYLLIGYLGAPSRGHLTEFNCTHLHQSHVFKWTEAGRFLDLARQALASGGWKGDQLHKLVQTIETLIDDA